MKKKKLIQKYPYLGYSPNLIEYFGIIGYQEEFISTIIKETFKTPSISNNPFPPTILNSVISNIDYGITDINLMVNYIFPNNPNLIKANVNDSKEQPPPPSSVIYSFCFDSTDGKKKLFYTCYAYKFYETYKYSSKNNEVYYVPKAFSIISQYAFYNTFHYICENILNVINTKRNTLPFEIMIYCILNYLPTPMNYNINLNVFECLIKTNSIKLEQLSGYPYIDFDLSELFNLLPINLILEIYILTFLEQRMLFFSQNLEILNMIMYIMFLLNYPCNDSIYFWHILSVPLDEFTEENKFVGKIMDSLLGVNSTYDESIDIAPFGKYCFIVDIENKKIVLKSTDLDVEEDEEDVKDLLKIQEFLQNCIKDKNIESAFLKNFIKELKTNLESILTTNVVYTPNPKNKYVDFFKISPKIIETNKKIQESFYNFCLNILMIFYKDNELNTSFDKITNKENKLKSELNINGKKVILPEVEKLICEFFRDTIKYKIYYENFIQNFDMMDIFKISLLFSEEFINLKICDAENKSLSNISFFKIIDTLYIQSIPQTINITINNLFSEYNEYLKKDFKHLLPSKNENEYGKQLFYLNRKILNKFIYLLNNNFENEEISELFPSSRLQSSDFISYIDPSSIKDIIHKYLIRQKIIKTSHCIIYAVVYVFALTMSLHPFSHLLTFLCEILKSLDCTPYFKRYYINIIIQTFHNYYLINEKENTYPDMNLNNLKLYYFIIVNYLKQHGIIPDKEIMTVLSYFFGGTILQEREIKNNSNINNENNNIINENNNNQVNNKSSSSSNYSLIANTPFPIKFKYNVLCFMRYSFQRSGIIKQRKMVKAALNENKNCNIIINDKKTKLSPIIVVKIKDYIYTSNFFSPIKILRLVGQIYSDFFENFNLDIKKINLIQLREIITNLIQYGMELNSVHVPFDFLIYTLYSLRNVKNQSIDEKKEEGK